MKIEKDTKFDIGDIVWAKASPDSEGPEQFTVVGLFWYFANKKYSKHVLDGSLSVMYELMSEITDFHITIMCEEALFKSKEEWIKAFQEGDII